MRWLPFFLLLAACDSRWDHGGVVAPDGHLWYRIECRHRAQCPAFAQDKCPDGYVKGDDTDRESFDESGKPKARRDDHRVMMVRCVSKDERK